jgi:alanine-synthesizing transaminase
VRVSPDRVVLTASTSEAYAHVFKLLCDPGDEVLVPRPSYPLFEELGRYEGVRLVPYDLLYDGAWHVDVDSARRAAGPSTRAVLVVSPNNPTGSCTRSAELRGLAALGLPLVVDEVFAEYPVDARSVTPALAEADGPMIVLDGLSKLGGLPQMKIAWMTFGGPEAFVQELVPRLEHLADAYLSVSGPAQVALPRWLERASGPRRAIRQRVTDNLAGMRQMLAGSAATIPRVEAGWYAMVRLPAVLTEEQWVLALLRTHGVLVHPGWFYETSGGPWVVVSLLTPSGVFQQGCRALRGLVDQLAS